MVFTSFLAANEKIHLFLLKTQLPIGKIQESDNEDALYTSSFLSFKYLTNLALAMDMTRHNFMPLSDTHCHRLIIIMILTMSKLFSKCTFKTSRQFIRLIVTLPAPLEHVAPFSFFIKWPFISFKNESKRTIVCFTTNLEGTWVYSWFSRHNLKLLCMFAKTQLDAN